MSTHVDPDYFEVEMAYPQYLLFKVTDKGGLPHVRVAGVNRPSDWTDEALEWTPRFGSEGDGVVEYEDSMPYMGMVGRWVYYLDEAYGYGVRVSFDRDTLQITPVTWVAGGEGTYLPTDTRVRDIPSGLWTDAEVSHDA